MNAKEKLRDLAMDLWWSWNEIGQLPFQKLNTVVWQESNHDPLAVLEASSENANEVNELVDAALNAREEYRESTKHDRSKVIAYFCSEFAIHESIPQYSGGLGVLAGDHVKSASDVGLPLVGIGRLYKEGYYKQELTKDGRTVVVKKQYDYSKFPITDTSKTITCQIDGHDVIAKIWKMQVGNSDLYFLDTDHDANAPEDRSLTQGLYLGSPESRLRQQILLGVGGVRALRELGIEVATYHLNEGHAAFANMERIRELQLAGTSFEDSVELIRKNTLFTTHTPVPAGHDRYQLEDVQKAMCANEKELALGVDPGGEDFCMTVLALRLSSKVNGVAKLHGEISRNMWSHIDGTEIGSVTNGIHIPTWQHPLATTITPENIMHVRRELRGLLVDEVNRRTGIQLDPEALTIGFARRFASYKRAPLIFRDSNRLAQIMNDPNRPVQLIFAGKAHPADKIGQKYLQEIVQWSHTQEFKGKVVVLEEYDMGVGRLLTSGCDVWLNTPIRPHEASGTSGMKSPLHGGINCSISDGWWPEAFDGTNGWVIGDTNSDLEISDIENEERDERDSNALYELLENEIVPDFYAPGFPKKWIARALCSLETIPPQFNTNRMVREYADKYYALGCSVTGSTSSSV